MNVALKGSWISIAGLDNNKIYAIICCIAYWLDSMGYGQRFKITLKQLITAYPQVDIVAMGFPKNWFQQALWV